MLAALCIARCDTAKSKGTEAQGAIMDAQRYIQLCMVAAHVLLVALVEPAKFKTNFHHIPSASAVSLPPELLSTSVREVSGGGVLECTVKCLGMVECLMFGLNSDTCLLWLPDPTASVNLTTSFPASGLYVRYLPETPHDCADLQRAGLDDDGPFWVFLNGNRWTRVYCDFHTDGGGWTIFQRRRYGGVDFYLNWADYKQGFGDIYKDFWLGNDNLHLLTSQDIYELRINLWNFEGDSAFVKYTSFKIGNEAAKYKLIYGSYAPESTAGNGLDVQNNRAFSTKDRDNDNWLYNCAMDRKGAWWYNACSRSSLNGPWRNTTTTNIQCVSWWYWENRWLPLMDEMKVRPMQWDD